MAYEDETVLLLGLCTAANMRAAIALWSSVEPARSITRKTGPDETSLAE